MSEEFKIGMLKLGFTKSKTYKPKVTGVSSYGYSIRNSFMLSIERIGNSNEFYPVLIIGNFHRPLYTIREVKQLLDVLGIEYNNHL